jgi:hypothetical protein
VSVLIPLSAGYLLDGEENKFNRPTSRDHCLVAARTICQFYRLSTFKGRSQARP